MSKEVNVVVKGGRALGSYFYIAQICICTLPDGENLMVLFIQYVKRFNAK